MQKILFILIITTSIDGFEDDLEDDYDMISEMKREATNYPEKTYKANWFDLDTRPLPDWYDNAKIGFLLHWGIYSVPAYHSEWFWYWLETEIPRRKAHEKIVDFMEKNYQEKNPSFSYRDFAPMFKAEKFQPDELAIKLREAGAKYVLITSKHHDGYALFPSDQSPKWNSWEVGPHRDLVGELAMAIRRQYMIFGIQYSLFEWFHPKYLNDKADKFLNRTYPETKAWPELKSLVNRYAPSIVRADGDREATSSYWQSEKFLSWLFTKSPVRRDVVVNDRWGRDVHCEHGSFTSCVDKLNPFKHKWENAFSLDTKAWGHRKNMVWDDILSIKELIETIADTVSCGGNVLLNIGLTKEGKIPELYTENLEYLGYWLNLNGHAIYHTSPWYHQTDVANPNVRYTCNKQVHHSQNPIAIPLKNETIPVVYAIFFDWPTSNKLKLKAMAPYFHRFAYTVILAGHSEPLDWTLTKTKLIIYLPEKGVSNPLTLDVAWTLKFILVTKQQPLREKSVKIASAYSFANAVRVFYNTLLSLLKSASPTKTKS